MQPFHQNQPLLEPQHDAAEGGTKQSCCPWLKHQPVFSEVENTRFSSATFQIRRGRGQRRLCLQPGVSTHAPTTQSIPASTCLHPKPCWMGHPADCHWLGPWVASLAPWGFWGRDAVRKVHKRNAKHGTKGMGSPHTCKTGRTWGRTCRAASWHLPPCNAQLLH